MSECKCCGLTAGDLPDDLGFDPELIFEDGLCRGCQTVPECQRLTALRADPEETE